MSVREMATHLEVQQLHNAAVTIASTNVSSVDGADFELGLTFLMGITTFTTGNFQFSLEEADDDGTGSPGVFTAVPAEKIVHPNGVQVGGNNFSENLSAVNANGSLLAKLGVFSNKRHVRPVIAGAATPNAVINMTVIKGAENLAAGVTNPADSSD